MPYDDSPPRPILGTLLAIFMIGMGCYGVYLL